MVKIHWKWNKNDTNVLLVQNFDAYAHFDLIQSSDTPHSENGAIPVIHILSTSVDNDLQGSFFLREGC
jgi:hypothetical protein